MFHPNIYADGDVCISILHDPGNDPHQYESAGERWLPIHTVDSILISVVSMLSDPNCESPANIEAAKIWRDDKREWRRRVSRTVRKSQDAL
jgi:ubiquitin-conjugating enzyme E2 G1